MMSSPDDAQTYATATTAIARLARLLERSCSGLSLSHYRVLSAVAAGEGRASRVAIRLSLGKPAISAAVEGLVAQGFLERAGDAADQRATSLTITPAGLEVLQRCQQVMNASLDKVLAHSGYPETALATLAGLGAAVDAYAEECASRLGTPR